MSVPYWCLCRKGTAVTASTASPTFDDHAAWSAIARFAKKLGQKGLEAALLAWFLVRDPEVDGRVKSVLVAALVYLGIPTDAVPDVIPVAGLADDIGVLIAAVAAVAFAIRPRHLAAAHRQMRAWGVS